MGIGMLFSVTWGCALYSWLYGVMSVREDLSVETFILLLCSQFSNAFMYICNCVAAVSYLGFCEVMVMSSA